MEKIIKGIGIATVYILLLYILLLILRPIYIDFIIQNISNQHYIDDLTMREKGFGNLALFVYSIISFSWLKRSSVSNNKGALFWLLNWIIDLLISPVSVLIMVLYHNSKSELELKNLSSVENFFLMWLLLGVKLIVFHIRSGNISVGDKFKPKIKIGSSKK